MRLHQLLNSALPRAIIALICTQLIALYAVSLAFMKIYKVYWMCSILSNNVEVAEDEKNISTIT